MATINVRGALKGTSSSNVSPLLRLRRSLGVRLGMGRIRDLSKGLRGLPAILPPLTSTPAKEPSSTSTKLGEDLATAEQFFLPPDSVDDAVNFRAPFRDDAPIEQVVDGIPTFELMEAAILKAKKSVHLAFWFFQPTMTLEDTAKSLSLPSGGTVAAAGVLTWLDLLEYVARQKVDVRVLLSDFDPIVDPSYHRASWEALDLLVSGATGEAGKNLQVVCSRHPAHVKLSLLDSKTLPLLWTLVRGLTRKQFERMPGLWHNVELVPKSSRSKPTAKRTLKIVASPDLTLFPWTHHQKLCIVDGTVAYFGGLDPAKGRRDTAAHTKMYWHDLDCRVEGEPVNDLEQAYASRWNVERNRFEDFVKDANSIDPELHIATLPTTDLPVRPAVAPLVSPGKRATVKAAVQILRTVSEPSGKLIPRARRTDIEESFRNAVGRAQNFIYIENQYLRAVEVGDWIVGRFRDRPQLQVIIVLPVAPEEAGNKTEAAFDPITKHGLFLQHQIVTRLRDRLKDHVGIFSMAAKAKVDEKAEQLTDTCGSHQVYVHSKTLIVDDRFANFGSANTNLRSFRADTELNASWFDPEKVHQFRKVLWNEMLGSPKDLDSWLVSKYVANWQKIATANCQGPLAARQGFIVPYDFARFRGSEFSFGGPAETFIAKSKGLPELLEYIV